VLALQLLVLLNPLIAKPFQSLILLEQFKHVAVPALSLRPLHEALPLSGSLHEGLQRLLAVLVECEDALDECLPARPEGEVDHQQAGLHELVAVGCDGGGVPADALVESSEIVVVEGVAQGGEGLAAPAVEHRLETRLVDFQQQ
jgi:hypothetical protein